MNLFEVKNPLGAESEILLFAPIGGPIGATAEYFKKLLDKIDSGNLVIKISSAGGSVVEGLAIAELLKAEKRQVTCRVDGVCVGVACAVAMAANKVEMTNESVIVLTSSSTYTLSNASKNIQDCIKNYDSAICDFISESIKRRHSQFSIESIKKGVSEMMIKGQYLTAKDALSRCMIDEIIH